MLKHLKFGDVFRKKNLWGKYREKLIFKEEKQLADYQKIAKKQIYDFFSIKDEVSPINYIPKEKPGLKFVTLQTSGAQSSICRDYKYPIAQYQIIEDHHWWRIEESHKITDPGLIVDLEYRPRCKLEEEKLDDCFIKSYNRLLAVGSHNSYKSICYNKLTSAKNLIKVLEEIKNKKPKAMQCSPSQLEWIFFLTKGEIKFDCPVVTTRETLYPNIREKGLKMFSKVIDKMRCWDGGLTFHECCNGTLHICDELCFVETLDDGKLCSTDFFNYCMPFIKYVNGDVGKISKKHCSCGVYGNFFESFEGRSSSLIKIDDYAIPGSILVEDISSMLRYGSCPSYQFTLSWLEKYDGNPFEKTDMIWCLRQKKDSSIQFICQTEFPLSKKQKLALEDYLNYIFYRHAGQNLKINKQEAEAVCTKKEIEIVEDKSLMNMIRGSRNKIQCVLSEMTD